MITSHNPSHLIKEAHHSGTVKRWETFWISTLLWSSTVTSWFRFSSLTNSNILSSKITTYTHIRTHFAEISNKMNSTKWLTCIAIITIAIGALQTILSSHSIVNINQDNHDNGGEIRNEESVEVARSSYHRLAVQFPPQTIRSSLTIPSGNIIEPIID